MIAKITTGIKVSVEAKFLERVAHFMQSQYVFVYRVRIENINDFPVQLISRHWYIFDSIDGYNEVQGEGVVGEQPLLLQEATYTYRSGCNLQCDFGTMHGHYIFENVLSGEHFKVEIPRFELSTSSKLN